MPLRLVYDGLPPDIANKDVLATYECFGNSVLREPFKESGFATPVLVVSDRLRDAILALGLKEKDVSFEPVLIKSSTNTEQEE